MDQTPLIYDTAAMDKEYYAKIEYSKERIIEWYFFHKSKVIASFSGGIDSHVLLDLVRKTIKEEFNDTVKGCFMDTGVEFKEIRDTVKEQENIITLYPKAKGVRIHYGDMVLKKKHFATIKTAGYPFWNKKVSMGISRYRAARAVVRSINKKIIMRASRFKSVWLLATTNTERYKKKEQMGLRLNGGINPASGKKQERSIPKMFHKLAKDGNYPISDVCCNYFKKSPAHQMYKETGLASYIGMKESDSNIRRIQLKKTGCNAYKAKYPTSNPLRYWTDKDVTRYAKENNLKICSLYNKDYTSTGCAGCTFGIAKDTDRFIRLKEHHPSTHDYYINKLDYKGFFEEVYSLSGIKIKH